jgi:class 3 adenylate cyclase/DNA-binding SARP family transcriptional activator
MANKTPLAAIMVADLADYSLHMKRDEAATVAFIQRSFDRARRCSVRFGGYVVKTTGDGWIAVFDSATSAVDCSHVLLRHIHRAEGAPLSKFRIGINVGEVRYEDGDIFGHAVNIAARIEALAEPGGIVVSQGIVAEVGRSPRYQFEALGHPMLKNIGDSVAVYRLHSRAAGTESLQQTDTRLRIRLMGGLEVTTVDGEKISIGSSHAAAIIGVLALDPERPIAADRLAVMLWPEKPIARAHEALMRARRLVNDRLAHLRINLLPTREANLTLNLSAVEIDLQKVLRSLNAGITEAVLLQQEDVPAELLAGFDTISPVLASWLKVRRTIWHDRIVRKLELCLERYDAEQPALRAAAEALLQLEPGHERASLALMQHHAATGWKEAALREFDRLSAHLRTSFDATPGLEVSALAVSLRDVRIPGRVVASVVAMPRIPQIAIGAFTAESPMSRTIAQQFRADLIANLSKFRTWAVFDVENETAGSADYAISASYEATRGEGRLQLRVIEPATRRIAWSESFSLTQAEWRKRQGQVIGRIASALEIYMSADRLSHAITDVPDKAVDYDDWLLGEALLLRWTPEAETEAEAIFRRLIERAPGFAPTYASLASILNVRHILQPGRRRTAEDEADSHRFAMRAVDLDPLDARNHLALAWSAALTGMYDQAAIHLDLAVSLNPHSPNTTISAAMGYAFLGDHARANGILDEAIRIAPMLRPHQWCYAAAIRFLGGDAERAEAAARRSGDQIVDNQGWLAAALVQQGRTDEARAAFARMRAVVAPIWAGDAPASLEAVQAWFVQAYPIRSPADRSAIADALHQAIQPVSLQQS